MAKNKNDEAAEAVEVAGSGDQNPYVQADVALIESAQRKHPEASNPSDLTAFVPDGDSRVETAKILVDAATKNGIDQRSIQAAQGGFRVTDELADVLYTEDD